MSSYIQTDYALDQEAKDIAATIFFDFKRDNGTGFNPATFRDGMNDRVHEDCDNSVHVIWTYRATLICGNCNTDKGEAWLEDLYGQPFDGCNDFAGVCTRLAFAELYCRTQEALDELIDNYEESDEEATEEEGEE